MNKIPFILPFSGCEAVSQEGYYAPEKGYLDQ